MHSEKLVKSTDSFKLNFGGDEHSIDAELFTQVMGDTINLIKHSANIIDPRSDIKLEIRANKEGSFETIINIIANHISDFVTKENIGFAFIAAQFFFECIKTKKHLGGKKAKEVKDKGQNTIIINQKGLEMTVTDEVAKESLRTGFFDNCVSNIFVNIDKSNKESISFKHHDNEVCFDRSTYAYMKKNIAEEQKKENIIKQELKEVNPLLRKPDLLGNSSWEFMHYKKIKAKIEDKAFLRRVQNGEIRALYSGVQIPCLLQIDYELDKEHQVINNKYVIKKIIGNIIEPPKQSSFFDKSL
ncbi:hypothetical protein OAP56_02800 [Rickettsiaceae bacterium]|nr:hypothetical protein [Rickettsiaceae bacterium]